MRWKSIAGVVLGLVFGASLVALPPTEKPLPPREAAAAMTVPDGFKVTLFAGEPDVSQPIAMCFDDRGRLWVAECHSYPKWIKDDKPGNDRIVILEDADNDGVFDKKTVFLDKLANLTSIEFGFGGIYALTAPYLVHIPIEKGTDRPAGPPVKLLDGWNLDIRHNIVNGLKWGPDGWLYGCHGILATSHAGKPGTPKAERPPINCGVWRFHPVTHKYEVVAHGGTNPWGIDWDEQGELYFTNCVIDHAFHVIPGGHYQRMYGSDFNPHLYKLMGSCVDHLHWAGGSWTSSRGGEGKHSEAGGGHAHSGCMIYLGDNFPPEYRNNLFTGNIHGNRINRDWIQNTAKGPVLRHAKDFLIANDPWFRPLAMDYGPDGGVYVIDWTDTGECHNYEVAHKTSGRIYKVMYGSSKKKEPPTSEIDLMKEETAALAKRLSSTNGWMVKHAKRLLYERFFLPGDKNHDANDEVLLALRQEMRLLPSLQFARRENLGISRVYASLLSFRPEKSEAYKLLEGYTPSLGFAVPFAVDEAVASRDGKALKWLEESAKASQIRRVRIAIASGLQRLPPADRWKIAANLAAHAEDSDDPQLPLLLWYAVESLPKEDLAKSIDLVARCEIPLVREFLARRIASLPDGEKAQDGVERLIAVAAAEADRDRARDILAGIQAALQGQRNAPRPTAWNDAALVFRYSPIKEVREKSLALSVIFGDERALKELRALVGDANADFARRQDALKLLVFKQPNDLQKVMLDLLSDNSLRGDAIRALAVFKDAEIPPRLIDLYPKLNADERQGVIGTLSSRPAFAAALLDAVAEKKIDRKDLGPVEVRQILALKDDAVRKRVEDVWGVLRPAAKDKAALLTKYKELLTADDGKTADVHLGKTLFTKHCATCHRLFGDGGAIGPDLTGSQRANLDYILENVLDPSAIVPREWQVTVFQTSAGRTVSGIIKEETDTAVTVQTPTDVVVLPKSEIEARTATRQSMMPEGVLEQLSTDEARALIAYLKRETPLAGAK